ncbi:hypothetical protein Z969_08280 [Clostridium novyi A str. 4570]|mgnify:FL=1|uniref:Uncharacterized protein n=1 Tax=Clostridium novyi A str. 4570 TaxID=1444290 RepID=A0AA88ZKP4_CLONO|nr:aspartyl-phosphate phosphatase Spo0E family protein [Clostridium novyi]KGN01534.1 hypothetical protein Z969_08280 [Clostridium novyi A str. 4570]
MGAKIHLLENQIQNCRENLHDLIYIYPLTDDIVVNCSHKLDKLLVEYEKNMFLYKVSPNKN